MGGPPAPATAPRAPPGGTPISRRCKSGLTHYRQSLRVVEVVENDGRGLNLTLEVRDGIIKHSKGRHGDMFRKEKKARAITLEGDVVRAADLIAYVSHDIDDAFRAGLLKPAD